MTIITFFLLRADLIPCVFSMYTLLGASEVAAKEPAVAVPLKDCSATLTGDAVVIAYAFEVLTLVHGRR